MREELGLEAAFWAQFPGNFGYIARRALVSSANFAGFASAHNFPVGKADGNHWGDAVTLFETTSAGPYFFNFHRGDLGNFTIIGPSGSGKTVVLGFLLAQARRYSSADRLLRQGSRRRDLPARDRRGLRHAAARQSDPAQPAGAARHAGQPPLPRRLGRQAGDRRRSRRRRSRKPAGSPTRSTPPIAGPPEHRRLRYLAELFRGRDRASGNDLAARLAPWHSGGEHAWLFDNEVDGLELDAETIGFDMTAILDQPALRSPTMLYLFHRVEERLDGQPTIIVVDEGWKALDDEVFVARIRDWEKTIRKRGGIVGFATQSASDALESKIASAIVEQAGTQIFMANASRPGERLYRRLRPHPARI